MEILEGIFALSEGCFCFLEIATLFFDGAAAFSGVKTFQKHKKAKDRHTKEPSWTPFIVLLIFAIGFTALTAYKYLRH